MSVYIKDPQDKAQACIIWMHGLGADSSDMMALVDQLIVPNVTLRHVFLDAPMQPVTLNGGMVMRAWYDILGMKFTDRQDSKGINKSKDLILKVIEQQVEAGFSHQQIYLAGFSQGGALALYTSLQANLALGGVIALSAYIPLSEQIKNTLETNMPVFMAAGQFDPLVLPAWTEKSRDLLLSLGFSQVAFHEYPMEHAVCYEELKDLSLWLSNQVQGELQ